MNLEEYKIELNKKLIESHFSTNNTVTGYDILNFTPEKQINLMIIYLLMEKWETEMENIKSPYFNYDSDEVKAVLKNYMNILSQNILIKKNDFEPLLKKAIEFTFQLVENPESFLIVNKLGQDISKFKKYIQYHKAYFEGDLDYEVNSKLGLVKENLSKIISLEKEKIDYDIDKELPVIKEEKVEPSIKNSLDNNIEESSSIHEKLSTDDNTQTVADKYNNELQTADINDVVKKIDSIKNAISINQRFILSNALFDGDTEQYMNAVERLDNCEVLDETKILLKEVLRDNYEKEEANILRSLIEQKFNLSDE